MAANVPVGGPVIPPANAVQPPPIVAQQPVVVAQQPAIVPPVPPAPIFALNPAAITGNVAFIDYNTKEGHKAYSLAIKPLETPYDGTPKGLQMFIHQIKLKATICGWLHTIFMIPILGQQLSLLTQYGQVTMQHIINHANTYMTVACKAQQDAVNFKLFLDGSLSKELMMRVLAQRDKYTINGQEHGPSMFRVILKIVGIETKATIAVINATLRTLPAKLIEVKHDIVVFNEYVTEQCLELTSRGQQPNDLLYLLFEAYLTSSNKIFVEYIRTKESAVFDNSIVDMEPSHLMVIAEDKYKIMLLRGEWKMTGTGNTATPAADEHIVALQAAVQALTEQVSRRSDRRAPKVKPGNPVSSNNGQWAWKEIAPKEGETHLKTVNSKEYVYCPHHTTTKWVLASKHKDGCSVDTDWKFPTKDEESKAPTKKKLQLTNAMMAVANKDYASSDDEDNEEENI